MPAGKAVGMDKPWAGFHVSIAGSIDMAVDRALVMGCTTFQVFTRNPRGWNYTPLKAEEALLFAEKRKKAGYDKVVAHMPYLPNQAGSDREMMKKSRDSLAAELARCDSLGIDYLVTHIGSNKGFGIDIGIENVIGACNEALAKSPGKTVLLLETMSGSRNSTGSKFEELRRMLDGINDAERVGICFDTSHVFAAGYDISSEAGVEETMGRFDDVVGYGRLKLIHLNDSKGELGSGLDRHEHLGLGRIGETGLRAFLQYRKNKELPSVMETPITPERDDAGNMKVARRLLAQ